MKRLLESDASALWGVVGRHKKSETTRFFPMTFGFASDYEECLRRVQKTYINDPEFRVKFKGWVFSPVLVSICFEITESGASLLYKNEKEDVA